MEIIVLKRFSTRDETGILKFYEVDSKPIKIDKKIAEVAIAKGYAKSSVTSNNDVKSK